MSWSVLEIGKAPAVTRSIELQFKQQTPCVEPEESIRQSAITLILKALAAQRPNIALKVSANGSMSFDNGFVHNELKINIEPIYGFKE